MILSEARTAQIRISMEEMDKTGQGKPTITLVQNLLDTIAALRARIKELEGEDGS